jgi:undecaprenyl-diphosphatase
MTLLQTIILAIIQGVTELFPISSVAHAVLTPFVFGWNLTPEFLRLHFLPVIVMLHIGTAAALLTFFWRDWLEFARSLFDERAKTGRAILLRLVLGTIPAAAIGFIFEKALTRLFASVLSAAFFLVVNGVLLYFGERARRRGTLRIEELGYGAAFLVGLAQASALVPGFSRSGASMLAGFWVGLSHAESARFSMLLATPIIAGAGILELPKLLHSGSGPILHEALVGGIIAGLVAFASVSALMAWFRRREIDAMLPFALYCWLVGGVIFVFG